MRSPYFAVLNTYLTRPLIWGLVVLYLTILGWYSTNLYWRYIRVNPEERNVNPFLISNLTYKIPLFNESELSNYYKPQRIVTHPDDKSVYQELKSGKIETIAQGKIDDIVYLYAFNDLKYQQFFHEQAHRLLSNNEQPQLKHVHFSFRNERQEDLDLFLELLSKRKFLTVSIWLDLRSLDFYHQRHQILSKILALQPEMKRLGFSITLWHELEADRELEALDRRKERSYQSLYIYDSNPYDEVTVLDTCDYTSTLSKYPESSFFDSVKSNDISLLQLFPGLETVELSLYPTEVNIHNLTSQLENIAKVSKLKRLGIDLERTYNAGEFRSTDSYELAHQLRHSLPQLKIRPLQYDSYYLIAYYFLSLCSLLPAVVLVLQLSGQHTLASARLTPGYTTPHFVVGVILYLLLLLPVYCLLTLHDADPLASIIIPFWPLILISLDILIRRRLSPSFSLYAQPLNLIWCLILGQMLLAVIVFFLYPIEVTTYMRGYNLNATITLLLLSITAMVYLGYQLYNLPKHIIQHGQKQVSLNTLHLRSAVTQEESFSTRLQEYFKSLGRKCRLIPQVSPLDQLTTSSKPHDLQQLWQLGLEVSVSNPKIKLAYWSIPLVYLGYLLYCLYTEQDFPALSKILRNTIYFAIIFEIFLTLAVIFINMITRRSTLLYEAMHPWQRFDYQKYLTQYITSELTFPTILIGIGFITLAGTQHFYLWPSLIFMTYLCLKLTVQVLSYLFTLKYLNSILLYGIPLCLILFFVSALMIEVQGFQNMQTLLFSIPGQIITISLLLASYYKFEPQLTHRWQNLEPAMLVRS